MSRRPKEVAQAIADNFKTIKRMGIENSFVTDGHMDYAKIFDFLRENDVAIDGTQTVPIDEVVVESVEVTEPIVRKLPKLERNDHYIFNDEQIVVPRLVAFRLKNVFLSYSVKNNGRPEFYFFDEGHRLINGLFYGIHPFFDSPEHSVNELCTFADDLFPKYNICHFMFDKYPRSYAAKQLFGCCKSILFYGGDYYDTIFEASEMNVSYFASNIRRGTVFLKECIVFSNSFHNLIHPAQLCSDIHLQALTEIRSRFAFATNRSDLPHRFFTERQAGIPRSVANRELLDPILSKYDIVAGDPGRLSALEQVQLFLNLEFLVGVHGAGLTNLLFQAPGSTVLELLPPMCATRSYWIPASALGHNYHHLVCEDPEFGKLDAKKVKHTPANNRRDVNVPVDEFEHMLSQIC